jgi:hypothetical protein
MENIPVSGLITPISQSDQYPIIDPVFGIDGLRNLTSTQSMYNLPLEKRRAGMVVGIADSTNTNVYYYKLKPQNDGVTWSVGDPTNWNGFLTSPTGSIPIKYNIVNETLEVPTNFMYLVYGNLTIGATGIFNNYGRLAIINGSLVTQSNGVFNNYGEYLTASFLPRKVVKTFSAIQNMGITVSHGLNTSDISYSLKDGYNFIQANVEISSSEPTDKVLVTCATSVSVVTMTIVG